MPPVGIRRNSGLNRSNRLPSRSQQNISGTIETLEFRHCLSTISFAGGELVYTAQAGKANQLTVSFDGKAYTFNDPADPLADVSGTPSGCRISSYSRYSPRPVTVEFPAKSVISLRILLGDKDDLLTIRSARDGITVVDGDGSDQLVVGANLKLTGGLTATAEKISLSGDVTATGSIDLTVPDSVNAGDDLTIPNGVTVQSTKGDVRLRAGDNLRLGSGSSVIAAKQVELAIDFANADADVGADATLGGTLQGLSGSLTGASDDDVVQIPVANGIRLPLAIDGRQGVNTLAISDKSDLLPAKVTLTGTAIGAAPGDQLFGVGGSVGYQNFRLLMVELGDGADMVTVAGSLADQVQIATGGGDDVVVVPQGFAGLGSQLNLDLGQGTDRVEVVDLGGGAWNGYRILAGSLARLAAGSLAVQQTIGFSLLEQLMLTTGSFTDYVEIVADGSGFPGLIDLNLQDGDDQVVVMLHDVAIPTTIDADGGTGVDSQELQAGQAADQIVATPELTTVGPTRFVTAGFEGVKLGGGEGPDVIDASGFAFGVTIDGGGGDDEIVGTDSDDLLFGGTGNNLINSGKGNDRINTGDGNDVIFGGIGDDQIETGDGDDEIDGGDGDDLLFGGTGNNQINAGKGNDRINTGDGNDVIFGGQDDDQVDSGNGDDEIDAGDGDDIIFGGTGNNLVNAGKGNDRINTRDGNDVIFGGLDDDQIDSGNGDDEIDAGDGDDIIFGGTGNNLVNAGKGNDRINTRDGNDVIFGGDGDDEVATGAGDDLLFGGAGSDVLEGGEGVDEYYFGADAGGSVRVIEPAAVDVDTIDFSGFGSAITVDLASLKPQVVARDAQSLPLLTLEFSHDLDRTPATAFAGIENVIGTSLADRIYGNGRNNELRGSDQLAFDPAARPVAPPARTQWVWLDFDSATDPTQGDRIYSQPERDAIQARIAQNYAEFAFRFTQDTAQLPAGDFARIVFNEIGSQRQPGQADEIDFRNLNLGGTATVDVSLILGGLDQPEANSINYIAASASIASHELGHLAGLRHSDAFGPIGLGIHTPPGSARFAPEYPGLAAAFETTDTLMASPASVGSTLLDAVGNPSFNERSAVKIAFSEYGSVISEAAANHDTLTNAQPVALQDLYVPNTLRDGLNKGKDFAVQAATVVSQISVAGEKDLYRFQAKSGDLLNFEIMSRSLARYRTNAVDGALRVLDQNGAVVSFFAGGAENIDPFENVDPLLVDLVIPADGSYYIEFSAEQPEDVGDYELFLYRWDAGNATDGGDIIRGLAGDDIILGGLGNDQIDGGTGRDQIVERRNADFTLSDKTLRIGKSEVDSLAGIDSALLFGGASANKMSASSFGGSVIMWGLEGDDELQGGRTSSILHGGDGNDKLFGSGCNDILLGDAGNDELQGCSGRDIMIGGGGSDRIVGGDGDDILIGGRTIYDANDAALTQLMDLWSQWACYQQRVGSLRQYLNAGSVSDDASADQLTGSSSDDWFLAYTGDITDRKPGEIVDKF
ncbi:MAG: calcium-binding protein [Pirellulales bacterium]